MLDKTIPYKSIIMRLDPPIRTKAPELPAGYSLRLYQPGDEGHWARIETSVLEFPSEERAAAYYAERFLPYPDELARRCVFAVDARGVPVATATAWWVGEDAERRACLHWVAVCPAHQGRGLGKAVAIKALSLFSGCGETGPVYLHTQTWSHTAVRMYASLGFRMLKTETFGGHRNDYAQAVGVLEGVLDPDTLSLIKT